MNGEELPAKVKPLIGEGAIRRKIIKDQDDRKTMEIPLAFGMVGMILAPGWWLWALLRLCSPRQPGLWKRAFRNTGGRDQARMRPLRSFGGDIQRQPTRSMLRHRVDPDGQASKVRFDGGDPGLILQ